MWNDYVKDSTQENEHAQELWSTENKPKEERCILRWLWNCDVIIVKVDIVDVSKLVNNWLLITTDIEFRTEAKLQNKDHARNVEP